MRPASDRSWCGPRAAGPALLLALATVPHAVEAQSGTEYHVDTDAPRSVTFTSTAQIEVVTGSTDAIDGFAWIVGPVAPGTPGQGSRLRFEVDLASIRTGIALRDRHMRDNYLETDAHPWAVLDAAITGIDAEGDALAVEADGTFEVHGVERPTAVRCGATPVGESFDVACAFDVALADHDIRIPRVMFLKLAETVRVEVAFRLAPVPRDAVDTADTSPAPTHRSHPR